MDMLLHMVIVALIMWVCELLSVAWKLYFKLRVVLVLVAFERVKKSQKVGIYCCGPLILPHNAKSSYRS